MSSGNLLVADEPLDEREAEQRQLRRTIEVVGATSASCS